MTTGRRAVVTALWVVVGALVLAWRAGWGVFPDADWLATRIVPALPSLPPLAPMEQYSMYSPIGSFVVALLPVRGAVGFELVHLGVLAVFVVALGVLVVRRHGWTTAGLVGAGFVGSQTAVVLLAWIGSYDVFTVGLTSGLVVVRDRRIAALLGGAAALAGFEQTAFVLFALLALSFVGIGGPRVRLAWAAIGLVIGRIALEVWVRANGVTHGRVWFLRETGVGHVLGQFGRSLPWLLLGGLGATVVAVVVAVIELPSVRGRIVVVGVLAAALVPTALALDQTRVFSILTWPVVLALLLDLADRADPPQVRRLAMATLAVAAVVPGIVVWEGRAQLSAHNLWREAWRGLRNP